jgi:biopolymer transport protein ExbB
MKNISSLFVVACRLAVLILCLLASAPPTQAQDEPSAQTEVEQAPTRPTMDTESYLSWFIRCSGLIGLLILGLSFYFVATAIRLFIDLRQDIASPPELISQVASLIDQRDLNGAYQALVDSDTVLGRTLSVGLVELEYGLGEAREVMERVGDAETVEMEKRISMLAVLGTLGPMIGLIGTLKGMISSFSVIAMSDVQLKSSEVAGGISEALLLTFEGVALSVPAIYLYAVFRNRVYSISTATMLQADELLRRSARVFDARSKPSTAAPPPPHTAIR